MSPLSLERKLALGTVQLGLPYGINNKAGKPDLKDSFRILDGANEHCIDTLDSADAYGDSIRVIGSYMKARPNSKFRVINKFVSDGRSIEDKLASTLELLSVEKLYGYMYHRFDDHQTGAYREELIRLRENNKIDKIGVSVYSVQELEKVVYDKEIALIQLPMNPFDSEPDKLALLEEAKSLSKEVHVRSVFLQGLFFKRPEDLTGNLTGLRRPLEEFHRILGHHGLGVMQACLNFALHQRVVDKVVIGVDTRQQLDENVEAVLSVFPNDVILELRSLKVQDRSLLNPSNWKP